MSELTKSGSCRAIGGHGLDAVFFDPGPIGCQPRGLQFFRIGFDLFGQREPASRMGELYEVTSTVRQGCISIEPIEKDSHAMTGCLLVKAPIDVKIPCGHCLVLMPQDLIHINQRADEVGVDVRSVEAAGSEHCLNKPPLVTG